MDKVVDSFAANKDLRSCYRLAACRRIGSGSVGGGEIGEQRRHIGRGQSNAYRRNDDNDRRKVFVYISALGKTLVSKLKNKVDTKQRDIFRNVKTDSIQKICDVLQLL